MWSWQDNDGGCTSPERSKQQSKSPVERPRVVVTIHLEQQEPGREEPPEADEPKRS